MLKAHNHDHFLSIGFILTILPQCECLKIQVGWEQVLDYSRGVYYVNHTDSKSTRLLAKMCHQLYHVFFNMMTKRHLLQISPEQVQSEDPRLEWRALQEDMLRQYLVTAQEDLQVS